MLESLCLSAYEIAGLNWVGLLDCSAHHGFDGMACSAQKAKKCAEQGVQEQNSQEHSANMLEDR